MSEPENPRWLNDASRELQQDVPVRAAWRTRLLDEIAHAPRPTRDDNVDDRFDAEPFLVEQASRRRSIVMSPLAGLAAAVLFVALGAGVMYAVMSSRAPSRSVAESTSAPT